jgi:hypothetical protein
LQLFITDKNLLPTLSGRIFDLNVDVETETAFDVTPHLVIGIGVYLDFYLNQLVPVVNDTPFINFQIQAAQERTVAARVCGSGDTYPGGPTLCIRLKLYSLLTTLDIFKAR